MAAASIPPPSQRDWLTATEAARALGIHLETARRAARRGELGAVRVGTVWRFPRSIITPGGAR